MELFKPPLAAALVALSVTVAVAQDYPSRPIRFLVPQTPGGASDALARITGQKLGELIALAKWAIVIKESGATVD